MVRSPAASAARRRGLNQLLDRFPTITFILWSGGALDVDPRLTRVEWLTPPVDVDREWTERTDTRRPRASSNV